MPYRDLGEESFYLLHLTNEALISGAHSMSRLPIKLHAALAELLRGAVESSS